MPATGVTALVTATAVLRLVPDGRVGLDRPANDYLRVVRLADDTITVRELLSHTAGIGNPGGLANPAVLFADRVPDLAALTGPVIASDGERGVIMLGNGTHPDVARPARIRDGQVRVTVTTRPAPLNHIHRRLMRAWARPAH